MKMNTHHLKQSRERSESGGEPPTARRLLSGGELKQNRGRCHRCGCATGCQSELPGNGPTAQGPRAALSQLRQACPGTGPAAGTTTLRHASTCKKGKAPRVA
ncbi:hypothetical protein AAFF_G00257770 [Aldrovandia affinis]|uniref:Uncharacterized protein n=1 Tax=Aldrovandia affinis TaxID=143900 RepID=A0AAD7SUD7_9TELE|nr:hypothetical protein AAFF_G00257770 [Aldrovandia affinis]